MTDKQPSISFDENTFQDVFVLVVENKFLPEEQLLCMIADKIGKSQDVAELYLESVVDLLSSGVF